jgi:DNA modification methylase
MFPRWSNLTKRLEIAKAFFKRKVHKLSKLKIEYKDINELIPYINNPRINDEAVDKVAASIKEFGFKNPILIDSENVIIAGHTRLKAARKLGLEEVPTIKVEDLTEKQIKAFRIADNKTSEFAEWDMELLEIELEGLDDLFTGFDAAEFDDIMGIDREVEEYDFDGEPPENPISKRGDIWLLGKHRLMCGDSTKEEDIEALIAGNKVDMIFTDPPYGMNLNTDYSGMKSKTFKGGIGGKKYEQGIVDEFTPEMIRIIMGLNVKETFIWGADYFAEYIPNRNEGSWIVWDKRANNNDDVEEDYSSDKMYGSCFELCWSRAKHKREIARVKWAGIFGLSSQDQNKRLHPTQKPLELCSWFINKYSNINNIILDLFGGSGSTLIACEQLNRICYMMELDEKYVDVIVDRYINYKGGSTDVYLVRDGEKIPYKEVKKNE